jgi:hypothetical protein
VSGVTSDCSPSVEGVAVSEDDLIAAPLTVEFAPEVRLLFEHAFGPTLGVRGRRSDGQQRARRSHPRRRFDRDASTKMYGQPVVGIEGQAASMYGQPGSTTLYVTRSSFPLPAFATVNLHGSGQKPSDRASNTFTRWGEEIILRSPLAAIPWSNL